MVPGPTHTGLGLAVEAVTIGAWAGVITAIVYIVLAILAARQLREAQVLREQQPRPFVVAELVPEFVITLKLKNIGPTMARNVTLSWDQWPEVTGHFAADPLWKAPDGSVLFAEGIQTLAPGQEISTLFDKFSDRVKSNLPMTYKLTVSYDNYADAKRDKRSYSETFVLDLNLYLGLRHIEQKSVHHLVKEMEKIRTVFERSSDGSRGLQVMVRDRERWAAREYRPIRIELATSSYKKRGIRGLVHYVVVEVRRKYGLHGWGE